MATFMDLLTNSGAGRQQAQDFTNALFGPRIGSDEMPIATSGEAFREYAQQRNLANSLGGLNPRQSQEIYDLALQGDYTDVARQYGLNQNDVYASATNQVSPFTQLQRQAQQANVSLGSSPLDPAYGQSLEAVAGQTADPYNQYQDQASAVFYDQAFNPLSAQEQQAAATFGANQNFDPFQAGAGTAAGTLSDTAGGAYVGQNPYLDQAFGRAAGNISEQFTQNILPSIESRFALSGRYGSDAMQRKEFDAADLVGQQMTDLATGMYGGAYGQERALQQNAASQLGGLYGQGASRQLQAAGGLANIGAGGQGRAIQAGGQLADLGAFGQDQQLQAAVLAPSLADAQFQAQIGRNNLVAGVGDQQRQLLDQLSGRVSDYYGGAVNDDFADLERLAGINSALGITGANGMGGVGQLQQNRAATGIGGALSGAALGAQVSGGNPFGALVGGGLGLIGGLL